MELIQVNKQHSPQILLGIKEDAGIITTHFIPKSTEASGHTLKRSPFIEANTQDVSLSYLKEECIIPVFTKDNEITISHQEFIEAALFCLQEVFPNEVVETPEVRVSHQIKGRTPDALHIPAKDLLEHQKTNYFERMAFVIRLPKIMHTINGNQLCLTIGGVRAYNQENLYNKKSHEKFKFFIGFQNLVCCNLCISTDGFQEEIRVMSVADLKAKIEQILRYYNANHHLEVMEALTKQSLTEKQFAQLIGKSRLYHYLPKKEKAHIPELLLNDSHFSTISKDYYIDESFCRDQNGNINLWNVYNLFTGANKGSYIDTFLERGVNAFRFTEGISKALSGIDTCYSWFLI